MTELYQYTVQTQARVSAARDGEILHHTPAHRILPGATVRGALAALWWRGAAARGEGADEFRDLFDRHLSVGQAVPFQDGRSGSDTHLRSVSARVCKYRSQASCDAFLIDLALLVAASQEATEPSCSACGGPTRDDAGWKDGYPTTRTTQTRLDADGTALDGNLFEREAMPKGTVLKGWLRAPSGTSLAWLEGASIRLGGKRSVMGQGVVSIEKAVAASVTLGERAAVRLHSPAIVLDRLGAATLAQDDFLRELTRVSGDDLALIEWWPRSERVTGWHMQSALPKPADWALAAGTTAVVVGLTATGWERLSAGIGIRTLEGYGFLELLEGPSGHRGDADPEKSELEIAIDALLEAFSGVQALALRSAHTALGTVRKARQNRWSSPEPTIAKVRKEDWFKKLGDAAKAQLNELFASDVLDDDGFLAELDRRIRLHGRQAGAQ